jgi:hypothetical protein
VFVGLLSQHAKRMRPIIFSFGLSGSTIFSTLSQKRHDFRETSIEHKKCVSIFSKILVSNILILRIIQPNIIINVHGLHVSTRYSRQIFKKSNFLSKNSNTKFHKNPSTGNPAAPSGLTDGQTDMTRLAVAFCNFAKEPKSEGREDTRTTDNIKMMSVKNMYCLNGYNN